jgi:hypothetical protein
MDGFTALFERSVSACRSRKAVASAPRMGEEGEMSVEMEPPKYLRERSERRGTRV